MNSFPMIKTKWSNEHIMAAVFLVLVLYHLPQFFVNPMRIFNLILLVGVGLLIDCIAVLLRYKRLWCCVSGAVTAAMVSLLTFNVPVWGQLLCVAVALILGKHVWGGTGKNLFNPAMIGLVFAVMIFYTPYPLFEPSFLLLPAVLLSLPFLLIRPFAGLSFLLGAMVAFVLNQDLSWSINLLPGILFFSCLVMTDPVTVTHKPIIGSAAGFLAGFTVLYFFWIPFATFAVILAVNLVSYAADAVIIRNPRMKARIKLAKVFSGSGSTAQLIDLTEIAAADQPNMKQLTKEEILARIRNNGVFGMGGAGFSTYQKLMTALHAKVSDKYLILNGAECDPGLVHDEWLLQNRFDEIKQGIELLKSCLPFKSVHLAVKQGHMPETGQLMILHQLPDRYPVGAERILIEKVLHKRISNGRIPASEGILVLNIQTVIAVSQAVLRNEQVETRYLTVADLRGKTAHVFKVRLGTKLSEVCEAVYPGTINVFAGGGIMQSHLAEEDEIVDKNVNFIAAGSFPDYKESPQCSKCGRCTRNCPSGLKVNLIADLVDRNKLKDTEKLHADDCISCGSCSYSCLAGRNLAAKVARAKARIRSNEAD